MSKELYNNDKPAEIEESLVDRLNRTNKLANKLAGEENNLPEFYNKKSSVASD
jgi:hypothetical protein